MTTNTLELITSSRLKSFRSCPRYHHLHYAQGVRSVRDSGPARFGTLFHLGLEHWWKGETLEECFEQMASSWASAGAEGEPDPFELQRAMELLRGYHVRWSSGQLTTIATELEFRLPLRSPLTGAKSRTYDLAGKIDAIARDHAGRHWVVEHKTTTLDISLGSEYWRRLRMDGQVSMYYDAAESLGFDVVGCLYDVALRPGLQPARATPPEARKYTQAKPARPGKPCAQCKEFALGSAKAAGEKLLVRDIPNNPNCEDCTPPAPAEESRLYQGQRETDETPEEFGLRIRESIAADPERYYRRGTVVRFADELNEHRLDTWHTAQTMRRMERDGIAPRNPDACVRYGSTCEFFPVCTGEASVNDETLYQLRRPHAELSDDLDVVLGGVANG